MPDDVISGIIQQSIADAAPAPEIAANEPIAGDETPASGDTPASEPTAAEAAPAAEEGSAAPAPAAQKVKRGPIPYDRHEAVLTKARNEHAAQIRERDERIKSFDKYESPDFKTRIQFLDILEKEPQRAIDILKQVDPQRFGKLTWAEQQAVAKEVAAAVAEPAEAPALTKPQPDKLDTDGTLTYSAEAAEKLIEWRLQQEKIAHQKELAAIRKEIEPLAADRKTREEERAAKAQFEKSLDKMGRKLAEARANWPEYTANEPAIKQYLSDNPTSELEEAYRAVVAPKLVANRDAIRTEERKKLIEEMNGRATAANGVVAPGKLPVAGAPAEEADSDTRITNAIKESIAGLRLAARYAAHHSRTFAPSEDRALGPPAEILHHALPAATSGANSQAPAWFPFTSVYER
jgi:hypothetical protein